MSVKGAVQFTDEQWETESQRQDDNGDPVWTPMQNLTYDSVTGNQVILDPNGPSPDNPRGWTAGGPNVGSGANSVLATAGVIALADGPEPFIGDVIGGFIALYATYLYASHEKLHVPTTILNDDNSEKKSTPPPTPGPSTEDNKTADELIGGSGKKSPSYRSELGGKTQAELETLAKEGGDMANRAKKMLKLIKEKIRLKDKGNKK